jgi:predicted GIY-YIG superfamily endonuclease
MTKRNTLYRFYDDSGQLLYIGISMTPWERFRQHRADKPWWDEIATITKENHNSREEVLSAEKEAIKAERPMHNVQHNRAQATRRGVRRQLLESLRPEQEVLSVTDVQGRRRTGYFWLVYEVSFDPISDAYHWDDLDPRQLFDIWYQEAKRHYGKDGYAPIYWFVEGPGLFESISHQQHDYTSPRGGFPSYYSLPVDSRGNSVELSCLPVINKRWDRGWADKGGFLPVATGWSPRALQSEVGLRSLKTAATRKQWFMSRPSLKWQVA